MMKANHALPLDGARNVRDLGGYPTLDGKQTRGRQFLRGDNPAQLTPGDKEALYAYGVRLQIDLRSDFECQQHPSALQGYLDMECRHFQLLDGLHSTLAQDGGASLPMPDSMTDAYIDLLDNGGPRFADIFRCMLRYPDDCVFFNCTAGKDRTGVTAMLLLKTAHCADDVIIADYAASYENIRQDVERLLHFYQAQGMAVNPSLFRSDAQTMEDTLRHFNQKYGAVEDWLTSAGLLASEIAGLRQKLLG